MEGDFYAGGRGSLRLRRAYGERNGILAGHTWSNFTTFVAFHSDHRLYGGHRPDGVGPGRHGQLRYTSGGFSVALTSGGIIRRC